MNGKAYFFRDVTNIEILKQKTRNAVILDKNKQYYKVTHEICLSLEEYEYFIQNLNRSHSFIKEITDSLDFTQKYEYLCALVYSYENRNEGILVNSQGYTYSKMSAMFKL